MSGLATSSGPDDLVERLNQPSKDLRPYWALCGEAAAEIIYLRGRVAELAKENTLERACVKELEAENARHAADMKLLRDAQHTERVRAERAEAAAADVKEHCAKNHNTREWCELNHVGKAIYTQTRNELEKAVAERDYLNDECSRWVTRTTVAEAALVTAEGAYNGVAELLHKAEAERDRMLAVIEAAKAMRDAGVSIGQRVILPDAEPDSMADDTALGEFIGIFDGPLQRDLDKRLAALEGDK